MNRRPVDSVLPPDVVILFPDDWAAYSPTLLRMTHSLAKSLAVRSYVLDTGRIDNSVLDPRYFHRIRVPTLLAKTLRKSGLYRAFRILFLWLRARRAITANTKIIAVDTDGAVAARLIGRPFHLLSLEIGGHRILRWLAAKHALSIVIQSKERLHYEFGIRIAADRPVFYIQNAPEVVRAPDVRHPNQSTPRLVYLGHLLPLHGLLIMLNLARSWPQATLTLAGLQNPSGMAFINSHAKDLIDAGRVNLKPNYIPEAQLPDFLSEFDLGLCFYEIDSSHRNFNYISSPAGKMFNYFSAGVPVIASNLIGLNPVSLHKAGIQVDSHDAETIKAACHQVLGDYESYSQGASEAAVHYDFRRAMAPFSEFLTRCTRRS